MEEKINLSKLSRVDELSCRKITLEQMLKEAKERLNDRIMLMLSKSFDNQVGEKADGLIVFLERWIKDIDKDIESL